jgi:hypothetical protein
MALAVPKTYKDSQAKTALSILSCDRTQMQFKLSYADWVWSILAVSGTFAAIIGFGVMSVSRVSALAKSSQEIISCASYDTAPPSCRLVRQPAMSGYEVLPLKRQQPATVETVGDRAYLKLRGEKGQTYRYGAMQPLTIAQATSQAQQINQFTNPRIPASTFEFKQQQQPGLDLWGFWVAALPLLGGLALAHAMGFEEIWQCDRATGKFSIQPKSWLPTRKLEFANSVVTQVQLATEYPTNDRPESLTKYNVHIFAQDGVWLRQGNTKGRVVYGFTQLSEAEQFAQTLRYHFGLAATPDVPQ